MTYFDYMDVSCYKTAPPVEVWKAGFSVNNELRTFAANIFRSFMFMPKETFNTSYRLKKALAMTDDTSFMRIVKDVFSKMQVGYPGMDGLDYHVKAFVAVKQFMDRKYTTISWIYIWVFYE